MESENNATLIDTLSLIFARAAELGALAPQFLTFTWGHFVQIVGCFAASHAVMPAPLLPNCISVPPPLNLCDVSTANLSFFVVHDKDCDIAVEILITCLVKVCQTLSIVHAHNAKTIAPFN